MAEPFIFIGTHRLKEGAFDDFAANCVDLARIVEDNEPRMIAFNVYANEAGTEVSVVQVHPDAESMLTHMQVVRQHITEAYAGSLEATTGMAVFGPPSDEVLAMMTELASPHAPLSVKPRHLAGFTRSGAAG